ncbi:MAG: hypothetical protein ACKVQT_35250 [Burkholderiales bacterium]
MLILAALAIILATLNSARADDWPAPQVREVFSTSRDHFVRVTPGTSWGDTMGFAGAKKGAYATAEFFRRDSEGNYRPIARTTLLNPVAPVEFFVSNNGRLVTLDNWHNTGYGTAVALYAANGTVVKAYTLVDIFTAEEIEAFPHSVSSIHWHKGPAYINKDEKTFYLMIKDGDDLILGLETGRVAYCRTRGPSYLCRDANDSRKWGAYGEVAPKR